MDKLIPGPLDRIDIFKRNDQYKLRVELLRKAGCKCENVGIEWGAKVGPYCRNCRTVVRIDE